MVLLFSMMFLFQLSIVFVTSFTMASTRILITYFHLQIRLSDINDEPPVFDVETASTEIPENTGVGNAFYSFGAKDLDIVNELSYSLGQVEAFSGDKGNKPINVTETGVQVSVIRLVYKGNLRYTVVKYHYFSCDVIWLI